MCRVSLTHPMMASFLCGDFLLHIPCWLHFYLGSFSYTSHAGFFPFPLNCGEFLLNIPCWFHFTLGVSLTHPMLTLFLCGEFLLHIPCRLRFCIWGNFSYTYHSGFIFVFVFLYLFLIGGVSLTHPLLASLYIWEFLLHIPCWLHFYLASLSYTSRAGFTFIWGVSLTHSMLDLLLSGEFLLHIPCWIYFYLGSFSYTSHAGFLSLIHI